MNTNWYIRAKGVFVFFFSLLHQLRHSFIISRKTSASHRTCAKKATNDAAQAKSNSIIAKRPAKRKSRAEEQYQVSILPLGKWRMWKTPFLYFFVHSHHIILAAALQGRQRTNISLLCALFFPEVFDKNCSRVLFFWQQVIMLLYYY